MKSECPMKFVVMYENVWAVYPDRALMHAARGPNNTIRHRPRYHDYWCDEIPDGEVSTANFENDEYSKISSKYHKMIAQEQDAMRNFGIGIDRLLTLLPVPTSTTILVIEHESIANESGPAIPLKPFYDLASLRASLSALQSAEGIVCSAKYSLKTLVSNIQFVRCTRSQMCFQKLARSGGVVDLIFRFLGVRQILDASKAAHGFGVTFNIQEKKANKTKIGVESCANESHEAGSMEVRMQDVIQDVEHAEPAAERDPDLLAEQARHDDADLVSRLLHGQPTSDTLRSTAAEPEKEKETVSLLSYTRYPESFRNALTNGSALHPCRTALEEAGFDWLHGSGAKIFVHPWQFEDSTSALSQSEVELRPYHVVVSASLEYNVEACLADIPCRDGARVKRRRTIHHVAAENPHQVLGKDHPVHTEVEDATSESEFDTQRTFLCETKRLRQPNSVTQSTTEANGGGMNPRRVTMQGTSNRSD